ncbi:MAG TPA: glycosyltransferase, partial [Rheinheimera sp.]|nr:glycosyltransferase [Rheinheimera sp.]
ESEFKHSIVTLTGHDEQFARRIQTNNVSFYCLNKAEGHDWGTFSRLNALLLKLQPEVLHSRNLATLELQLIGWWRKVPLRLHGEHGWDSSDIGGSNKKNRLIRRLFKPFVHSYICLSSESERYLSDIIRVKPSKIHRICNGVDTDKYANATPAKLPLADGNQTLLFGTVGRLATVKNQALLLRSFALLLKQEPSFKHRCILALIGDGPCRQDLEKLAAELGISDHVIFTGNRADIPELMQRLDVFILPSLAEGISNTILEAMASGTPVIATDVGGNADLLPVSQLTTNLVPSNEPEAMMLAMQRYLEQPTLLAQDAAIVEKHCQQNFSLDTMVNKYRKLYEMKRTQS